MGAHTFQTTIAGKKLLPNDAYDALVKQAQHEHGHDPYNGTISTTSGYVMLHPPKGCQLDVFIRRVLEDGDGSPVQKWGPAGCIEVTGAKATAIKKAHGLDGTRARAYIFIGWAAS